MKTLTQALTRLGFQKSSQHKDKTIYQHPELLASCTIVGDSRRLKVDQLSFARASSLHIIIGSDNYLIQCLDVSGSSQLLLRSPLVLGRLSIYHSTVRNLSFSRISKDNHHDMTFIHSDIDQLTLDMPDGYRLDANYCTLSKATVNPRPRPQGRIDTDRSTIIHLKYCIIKDWFCGPKFIIASSLEQVKLFPIQWSNDVSDVPELVLHADDVTGTVLNLCNQPINYRLMSSGDQLRLVLGCWLGNLETARALVESDVTTWPSYHSYCLNPDLPTGGVAGAEHVIQTRQRYRAVLTMLESLMSSSDSSPTNTKEESTP